MFHSIVEAVGTGSPMAVAVPPYLDQAHISVYIDGAPTTAYTWQTSQSILITAPAGRIVRTVRRTSHAARLTDYQDGTSLPADKLDLDSKQAFYMAQEALDICTVSGASAAGGIGIGAGGLVQVPGFDINMQSILAGLEGQLTLSKFAQDLRDSISKIEAPAGITGSVAARIAEEAAARAAADLAQFQALVAADTQVRSDAVAAVAVETQARAAADSALASQITTVAASAAGAHAAVQQEQTARTSADAALASDIDTVVAFVDTMDTRLAAVETASSTSAELNIVKANYTIKVNARADGKNAIAGIGLNATASTTVQQSEIVFVADKFTFVPSMADINAVPSPLFVSGLVDGVNTFVLPSSRIGDQAVSARMTVDGLLQARHFVGNTALLNAIQANQIDTRGLSIKDASGNIILAAGTALNHTNVTPSPGWLNSGITVDSSGRLQGIGAGAGASVANSVQTGFGATISRPAGAQASSSGPTTGALRIVLPQYRADTMLRLTVEIMEYTPGGGAQVYEISGYHYNNGTWFGTSATYTGNPARSRQVSFGEYGGKSCIWIGAPADVWEYPHAFVSSVATSFQNYATALWETNWAMSWTTSAPTGVTATVASPKPGGAFSALDQLTAANVTTYIAAAAIGSAQVGVLTAQNLSVQALSNTVNGGLGSGGRVVIDSNKLQVFDANNALRVKLGYLL